MAGVGLAKLAGVKPPPVSGEAEFFLPVVSAPFPVKVDKMFSVDFEFAEAELRSVLSPHHHKLLADYFRNAANEIEDAIERDSHKWILPA